MTAESRTIKRAARAQSIFIYFILFFSSAVYFMPARYAVSSQIYNVWVALITAVSILTIGIYLRRCVISVRWLLLSFAITFYYLITTVLFNSGGGLFGNGFNAVKLIGFISLLEYGFQYEGRRFLKAFLIAGVMMCLINYATFLQYGHLRYGMRLFVPGEEAFKAIPWLFFTHDNGTLFYYLPVMLGLWYYTIEIGRKLLPLTLLFTAATLYMYVKLSSMTAMASSIAVAIAACIALLAHSSGVREFKAHSLLSYKKILLLGICINFLIVVFSTSSQMGIIASFFNKPTDLSGRIFIWERALESISRNIICGLGQETGEQTALRLGLNHAHNLSLQILYCSGLIGALLFVTAFLKYDIPKERRRTISVGQAFILFVILVFFIAASFDWYLSFPAPIFMFALYAYSHQLDTLDQSVGDVDG